jgi:hypothetical protein
MSDPTLPPTADEEAWNLYDAVRELLAGIIPGLAGAIGVLLLIGGVFALIAGFSTMEGPSPASWEYALIGLHLALLAQIYRSLERLRR